MWTDFRVLNGKKNLNQRSFDTPNSADITITQIAAATHKLAIGVHEAFFIAARQKSDMQ